MTKSRKRAEAMKLREEQLQRNWEKAIDDTTDSENLFTLAYAYYTGTFRVKGFRDRDQFIQDKGKAVSWFQKAAELGNLDAMNYLGHIYALGDDEIEQDVEKAIYWLQKAAEAGHVDAISRLGDIYRDERFGHVDKEKARTWFLKAAEQGDGGCMWCLGGMYRYGEGVPQDIEKSLDWHRKAIEAGCMV